jgi:hypothetical protein
MKHHLIFNHPLICNVFSDCACIIGIAGDRKAFLTTEKRRFRKEKKGLFTGALVLSITSKPGRQEFAVPAENLRLLQGKNGRPRGFVNRREKEVSQGKSGIVHWRRLAGWLSTSYIRLPALKASLDL